MTGGEWVGSPRVRLIVRRALDVSDRAPLRFVLVALNVRPAAVQMRDAHEYHGGRQHEEAPAGAHDPHVWMDPSLWAGVVGGLMVLRVGVAVAVLPASVSRHSVCDLSWL